MPHRKRFLIHLAIILPLLLLTLAWPGAAPAELVSHADARPLMGTLVTVTAEGSRRDVLEQGANAAYREMSRLSDMMNH